MAQLLGAVGDLGDFFFDDAFDDRGQVLVEPSLEHGA